mgnify:FL=1
MRLKVKKSSVKSAEDIANILFAVLVSEDPIDQQKEHFWAIGLNGRGVMKYVELVSLGIVDRSLVHPRETFRLAIFEGVEAIIVAHNHPSGDCKPSNEDGEVTKNLVEAGRIVGIKILDHIIIGENSFYSFFTENPEIFK